MALPFVMMGMAQSFIREIGGKMHDSRKRQKFASGAVRDAAEGKPRPDLISPYANLRIGEWLREGAEKYAERNWEAGMPISRCVASRCADTWRRSKMGRTDEDHLCGHRSQRAVYHAL